MFDNYDPGFLSGFIGVVLGTALTLLFQLSVILYSFSKLLKNLEDEVQTLQNSRELDMLVQEASIMMTDARNVPRFHIRRRYQIGRSMDKLISLIRYMSLLCRMINVVVHRPQPGAAEEMQRTVALPGAAEEMQRTVALTGAAEETQRTVALPDAAEEMQQTVALPGAAEEMQRKLVLISSCLMQQKIVLISDIRTMSLLCRLMQPGTAQEMQRTVALLDATEEMRRTVPLPDAAEEMQRTVPLPDAAEEMHQAVAESGAAEEMDQAVAEPAADAEVAAAEEQAEGAQLDTAEEIIIGENPMIAGLRRRVGIKPEISENDQRRAVDKLDIELSEKQSSMAELEWYKESCEKDGGIGYYDTFKNQNDKEDIHADMRRLKLAEFWDKIIEMWEGHELPSDFEFRKKWINAGHAYRIVVEPLDIAHYYRTNGNGNYLLDGRPNRHKVLQKWMEATENLQKPRTKCPSFTSDSCFWAHVEEALKDLENMKQGLHKLDRKFEQYVTEMEKALNFSSDVFLEGNSFMRWLKERMERT